MLNKSTGFENKIELAGVRATLTKKREKIWLQINRKLVLMREKVIEA